MKDIICKEINILEIKKYQMEILVRGVSKLFVPVSFKTLEEFREEIRDTYAEATESEDLKILACYDISGLDLLPTMYDGAEAPYLATELLRGMSEAMDNYIMPGDYTLSKESIYRNRQGRIKLVFIPAESDGVPKVSLGQEIKRKIVAVLEEIYPEAGIAYEEILMKVKDLLRDETIGLDSCLRALERFKSEAHYIRCGSPSLNLDLSPIML